MRSVPRLVPGELDCGRIMRRQQVVIKNLTYAATQHIRVIAAQQNVLWFQIGMDKAQAVYI